MSVVKKHGAKRWNYIATFLGGRNGKQCRERYLNHLDPSINKETWSVQEDDVIYQSQLKFKNQWSKMSKLLPGRTANAVKNRWNSTLKRKQETYYSQKKSSEDSSDGSSEISPRKRKIEEEPQEIKSKREEEEEFRYNIFEVPNQESSMVEISTSEHIKCGITFEDLVPSQNNEPKTLDNTFFKYFSSNEQESL